MKLITVRTLLALLQANDQIQCDSEPLLQQQVTTLCLDSRSLKKNAVFCACPGEVSDGRAYVDRMLFERDQVSAIFYQHEGRENYPNVMELVDDPRMIAVPNLKNRLSELAAAFYDDPSQKMHVVGVTGTNGKTSVSFLYSQVANTLGYKTGLIGTLGSGLSIAALIPIPNTTPDPITVQRHLAEFVAADADHAILEISSHALVQQRVSAVAVDIAIYTNLTQDHLDYHYSIEAYAAAKAKLLQQRGLKTVILNADDAYCAGLQAKVANHLNTVTFAVKAKADVCVEKYHYDLTGTRAHIITPWGEGILEMPLLGPFNLSNALAVISALCVAGADLQAVLHVFRTVQAPLGRLQTIRHQGRLIIIDYAHTPDALAQVLKLFRSEEHGLSPRQLVCLFGCGGDRDQDKRAKMGAIAAQFSDRVILTNDNPRHEAQEVIIEQIASGIINKGYDVIFDRKKAIESSVDSLQAGDVLIIAGKGHETYQEIKGVKYPFSDAEVVTNCFEAALTA